MALATVTDFGFSNGWNVYKQGGACVMWMDLPNGTRMDVIQYSGNPMVSVALLNTSWSVTPHGSYPVEVRVGKLGAQTTGVGWAAGRLAITLDRQAFLKGLESGHRITFRANGADLIDYTFDHSRTAVSYFTRCSQSTGDPFAAR
jgi:hypothetical protein